MERICIVEDGLTLFLLLFSQGVTFDQLVDDLIGFRKVSSSNQFEPFLYQDLFGDFIWKYLLEILENGQEELSSLSVVRPSNWLI